MIPKEISTKLAKKNRQIVTKIVTISKRINLLKNCNSRILRAGRSSSRSINVFGFWKTLEAIGIQEKF
jgi:hypothetical protein